MIVMKKSNKVYSTSDFTSAASSVVVDNCYWCIDDVSYTKLGEYSKTPLFVLELRRIVNPESSAPNGWEDASPEMEPNRTYFVREGRPLYNALVRIWDALDGDSEDFANCVMSEYKSKAFRGRVELLSGVSYTTSTRRGTIVNRSSMEVWYPEALSVGRIIDDFVYLCNIGVYTPVVDNTPTDPVADALKGVDPSVVAAVMTALGKK